MGRRKSTEEFISEAEKIHNYFYSYEKVDYKNNKTKIIITCPVHGDFKQSPVQHLRYGCWRCGVEKRSKGRRLEREDFIKRSKTVHKIGYDYSRVKYINAHAKVKISCPIHGEFEQTPTAHLHQKQGCPVCRYLKSSASMTKTTENFIKGSKNVHGDLYDYSLTKYVTSKKKVRITCKIHGEFQQLPTNHLNGKGCKECSKTNFNHPVDYGESYKSSFLYVLKIFDQRESFYKIGISINGVQKRFIGMKIPYNYEILREVEMSGYNARMCELELHHIFTQDKYSPNIWFSGHTECFNNLDLPLIDQVIDWFSGDK